MPLTSDRRLINKLTEFEASRTISKLVQDVLQASSITIGDSLRDEWF